MRSRSSPFVAALALGVAIASGAAAQTSIAPTSQAPVPPPPGPDLRVSAVSVSKVWNCKGSDAVFTLAVRIVNSGNRKAEIPRAANAVLVKSKVDPRWSATGNLTHLAGTGPIVLDPGEHTDTYVVLRRFTLAPNVMKGTSLQFSAVVDPDKIVAEQSEVNNVTAFTTPAVNPACIPVT